MEMSRKKVWDIFQEQGNCGLQRVVQGQKESATEMSRKKVRDILKEGVQMRTVEGRAGEERVRNGDVPKKSPGQFERSSADADCKGAHRCQGVIRQLQRCAQMPRRYTATTKVRSDHKESYGDLNSP